MDSTKPGKRPEVKALALVRLVLGPFIFLFFLQLLSVYFYTKGFFLTRIEIPLQSTCLDSSLWWEKLNLEQQPQQVGVKGELENIYNCWFRGNERLKRGMKSDISRSNEENIAPDTENDSAYRDKETNKDIGIADISAPGRERGENGKGKEIHPRLFKKVVIIVIDALRYDFLAWFDPEEVEEMEKTTPGASYHLDKLPIIKELLSESPNLLRSQIQETYPDNNKNKNKKNLAFLFKFEADPPTTTMQRLKGLTTGSLPTFIDFKANFASPAIEEDNWVSQAYQNGLNLIVMGDDTWESLFPHQFMKKYLYPSFNTKDIDTVDNGCLDHLLPELQKNFYHTLRELKGKGEENKLVSSNTISKEKEEGDGEEGEWDILISHFLGVDHIGHTYGPLGSEISHKLDSMDQMIRNILDYLEDDTLLLIMGDHGMTDGGNHGGATEEETGAGLFAYLHRERRKEIKKINDSYGEYDEAEGEGLKHYENKENPDLSMKKARGRTIAQVDLVPTISLVLGLPIPYNNLGQVIPELLLAVDEDNEPDPLHNISHVSPFLLDCLFLNAEQVWRYIQHYASVANSFISDHDLEILQTKFLGAVNKTKIYLSKSSSQKTSNSGQIESFILLQDACNAFQDFLTQCLAMGRGVWTQYDTITMYSASILMLLSFTFALLYTLTLGLRWVLCSSSSNLNSDPDSELVASNLGTDDFSKYTYTSVENEDTQEQKKKQKNSLYLSIQVLTAFEVNFAFFLYPLPWILIICSIVYLFLSFRAVFLTPLRDFLGLLNLNLISFLGEKFIDLNFLGKSLDVVIFTIGSTMYVTTLCKCFVEPLKRGWTATLNEFTSNRMRFATLKVAFLRACLLSFLVIGHCFSAFSNSYIEEEDRVLLFLSTTGILVYTLLSPFLLKKLGTLFHDELHPYQKTSAGTSKKGRRSIFLDKDVITLGLYILIFCFCQRYAHVEERGHNHPNPFYLQTSLNVSPSEKLNTKGDEQGQPQQGQGQDEGLYFSFLSSLSARNTLHCCSVFLLGMFLVYYQTRLRPNSKKSYSYGKENRVMSQSHERDQGGNKNAGGTAIPYPYSWIVICQYSLIILFWMEEYESVNSSSLLDFTVFSLTDIDWHEYIPLIIYISSILCLVAFVGFPFVWFYQDKYHSTSKLEEKKISKEKGKVMALNAQNISKSTMFYSPSKNTETFFMQICFLISSPLLLVLGPTGAESLLLLLLQCIALYNIMGITENEEEIKTRKEGNYRDEEDFNSNYYEDEHNNKGKKKQREKIDPFILLIRTRIELCCDLVAEIALINLLGRQYFFSLVTIILLPDYNMEQLLLVYKNLIFYLEVFFCL